MRAECRAVDRVDPPPPAFQAAAVDALLLLVLLLLLFAGVMCGVMPGRAHWAVMTQIPCFS